MGKKKLDSGNDRKPKTMVIIGSMAFPDQPFDNPSLSRTLVSLKNPSPGKLPIVGSHQPGRGPVRLSLFQVMPDGETVQYDLRESRDQPGVFCSKIEVFIGENRQSIVGYQFVAFARDDELRVELWIPIAGQCEVNARMGDPIFHEFPFFFRDFYPLNAVIHDDSDWFISAV